MVACVVLLAGMLFNGSPASAATLQPCVTTPPPGPVIEMDGNATIVTGKSMRKKLRRSGVKVSLADPANNFTGRPEFPVTSVPSQGADLKVGLGGGMILRGKGKRRLFVKQMSVQGSSQLVIVKARFAGSNRRLMLIQGARFEFDETTGENTVTGGKAFLSNVAVKVFRKRLNIKPRVLRSGVRWGNFDLYSLYKVTLPPEDPEAETPPVPPVAVRPGTATDLASATIDWRVRESFIRYVSSGDGASAIDGAIPGPAEELSGAPPLVYSFGLPFTSGWTDAASETALVKGSGGVAFRYCRNTINFHVNDPEIELNGANSRMIFRVNGLDGTAFPNQRAVVVDLDLTQAEVSTSGNTTTWENIPGSVPGGSAGVFADFYFGGAPFGELDLTVSTP